MTGMTLPIVAVLSALVVSVSPALSQTSNGIGLSGFTSKEPFVPNFIAAARVVSVCQSTGNLKIIL